MAEYIDKDKLLDELKESAEHHAENSREEQLLLRDRNIVRAQPAADVAPIIHAEWAHQYDDYFDWWECTNCGYGGEGEMQFAEGVDVRTNYCPNCGAKMDKEVQE